MPYPIYALRRMVRIGGISELPSVHDAIDILEMISPRPPISNSCPMRHWPNAPVYDVSVIVPCYNVELYIRECLESILCQKTRHLFEVIAIDDGSTDATGVILDGLAAKNEKLRVIHQQNEGLSSARNKGIDLANGACLMFVDADDVLESDAIELLAGSYDASSCDYVTASYVTMNERGKITRHTKGKRSHGAPWARLYSREVWRDIEFPIGFWFEDTVQAYCVRPKYREFYLDKSVYRYRRRAGSISARCGEEKKGLDSYWVIDEMLRWCDRLEITLGQSLLDQTLRQLGPLLYCRTLALSESERKALFVAAGGLISARAEWTGLHTSLGRRWRDIEMSLREGDYALWKLLVSSM